MLKREHLLKACNNKVQRFVIENISWFYFIEFRTLDFFITMGLMTPFPYRIKHPKPLFWKELARDETTNYQNKSKSYDIEYFEFFLSDIFHSQTVSVLDLKSKTNHSLDIRDVSFSPFVKHLHNITFISMGYVSITNIEQCFFQI